MSVIITEFSASHFCCLHESKMTVINLKDFLSHYNNNNNTCMHSKRDIKMVQSSELSVGV